MSTAPMGISPYKGLMPYSEEDAPFFFGRDAETDIITANLMASRLTLLYGTSGVGKSSVLRAGVAHRLRETAQQNSRERGVPELAVVVFSSWRDDPVSSLSNRIRDQLSQTLAPPLAQTPTGSPSSRRSLVEILRPWTEHVGGDLLIILDQFEEYFLYHEQEEGEGTFAVEFPRALNDLRLRASFLISIREDALARLDRFKGRIPNLFDNYLRIDHLDREAARSAIEQPLAEYNRRVGEGERVRIEPALVEAVLDQVTAGRVTLGEAARPIPTESPDGRIETPYLQMVMTRLWNEEVGTGSRVLRAATLERLGGAERIVRMHLDATMEALSPREQAAAANVFRYLVTPSGTKIAHTSHDLAYYAGIPEADLNPVLQKLSDPQVRVLRPVNPPPEQPGAPRYEIFHDVLAASILDWRARYALDQERSNASYALDQERSNAKRALAREQRRVARLRVGVVALLLLFLASAGVGAYLYFVPSQMSGAINIAIADFGEVGPGGQLISTDRGRTFSRLIFAELERTIAETPSDFKYSFQLWHDSLPITVKRTSIGLIQGVTSADRSRRASQIAADIKADVLIYGIIDQNTFTPESYIVQSPGGFAGTEAQTAIPLLLRPITINTTIDQPSQLQARAAARRGGALIALLSGAAVEQLGDSATAYEMMQFAEQVVRPELPADRPGLQVFRFLNGWELLQQDKTDLAQIAFHDAIDIDSTYASPHFGLGLVNARKMQKMSPGDRIGSAEFSTANSEFAKALSLFKQTAPSSPGFHIENDVQTGYAFATYLLAEGYLDQGDLGNAAASLDRAVTFANSALSKPIRAHDYRLEAISHLILGASDHKKAYILLAQNNRAEGDRLIQSAITEYQACLALSSQASDDATLNKIAESSCRANMTTAAEGMKEDFDPGASRSPGPAPTPPALKLP